MLGSLVASAKGFESIDERMLQCGVSRRAFLQFCATLMIAAPYGLAITGKKTPEDVAAGLGKVIRPPIIWLAYQDCTGCTESLLQTSHPGFGDLILNVISLEYHETLMAGSGLQARQALDEAVTKYAGKYVLVVEGSIPTGAHGIYMKLAGRPAMDILADVGSKAAAIIAIGSCATWGGIPSADPDPTGAVGVVDLMPEKSIVNLPGCPPNPYTVLGVLLQFAADGTLPESDCQRRPKFAYDRDIHEHCPRRAHFDAGNFVKQFGDEGHRDGWCLYEMGCKGPETYAGCSTRHFNEIDLAPYLYGQGLVILVDAVQAEEPPGALCIFSEHDLLTHHALLRLSAHDPGVRESLAHLSMVGRAPTELIIVGVVPEQCEFASGISANVMRTASLAVDTIAQLSTEHGIECSRRDAHAPPNLWWLPVEHLDAAAFS